MPSTHPDAPDFPCPRCGSSGYDVGRQEHDCLAYTQGQLEALQKDHERVCNDNDALRAALFAVRPGGADGARRWVTRRP